MVFSVMNISAIIDEQYPFLIHQQLLLGDFLCKFDIHDHHTHTCQLSRFNQYLPDFKNPQFPNITVNPDFVKIHPDLWKIHINV